MKRSISSLMGMVVGLILLSSLSSQAFGATTLTPEEQKVNTCKQLGYPETCDLTDYAAPGSRRVSATVIFVVDDFVRQPESYLNPWLPAYLPGLRAASVVVVSSISRVPVASEVYVSNYGDSPDEFIENLTLAPCNMSNCVDQQLDGTYPGPDEDELLELDGLGRYKMLQNLQWQIPDPSLALALRAAYNAKYPSVQGIPVIIKPGKGGVAFDGSQMTAPTTFRAEVQAIFVCDAAGLFCP